MDVQKSVLHVNRNRVPGPLAESSILPTSYTLAWTVQETDRENAFVGFFLARTAHPFTSSSRSQHMSRQDLQEYRQVIKTRLFNSKRKHVSNDTSGTERNHRSDNRRQKKLTATRALAHSAYQTLFYFLAQNLSTLFRSAGRQVAQMRDPKIIDTKVHL